MYYVYTSYSMSIVIIIITFECVDPRVLERTRKRIACVQFYNGPRKGEKVVEGLVQLMQS